MKRVIWITGVPGSGKSAIGERLVSAMKREFSTPCALVDANFIRKQFWPHLGLSPEDRVVNVIGMAEMTGVFVRAGNDVIVACIAPDRQVRNRALGHIRVAAQGVAVYQVYVTAPLDVLRTRDHKGLYEAQAAGKLVGLTGVDAVYEPPTLDEALFLDTAKRSVAECVQQIVGFVKTTPAREWGSDEPESRRYAEAAGG
jgi:adenylylsulfate kinase-like enzyme